MATSQNTLNRFWNKVAVRGDDDCWEWTGALAGRGYGVFGIGPRRSGNTYRQVYAHRLSWSMATATDVPDGLFVLHSCDNPACVNPRHLSVGTQAENMRQACERGRMRKGDRAPNMKIKEADLPIIRQRIAAGETLAAIAADYGVAFQHIGNIKSGHRRTA